jgi:hypothetical protein
VIVIMSAIPTSPRPHVTANIHASGMRRSDIEVEITIGGTVSPAPEKAPFRTSSMPVNAWEIASRRM